MINPSQLENLVLQEEQINDPSAREITAIGDPKEMRKRAIELVRNSFDQSARGRKRIDDKRVEWIKLYNSISEPVINEQTGKEITTLSNLFVPWIFGFVEQRVPRIIGRLPQFYIVGEDQQYDQQWAEVVQQMLRKDLDRAGYFQSAVLHVKQAEIYGWSVRRNFWRHQLGERTIRRTIQNPFDGSTMGTELVKETFPLYDCPWTDVVDIWRCYPQPGALSIEDSDWFIMESIMSRKQIWSMVETGCFDRESVMEMFDKSPGVSYTGGAVGTGNISEITDKPFWTIQQALGRADGPECYTGEDYFPRHQILTFWTDKSIITLGDREFLLRKGDPHRPGVDYNPYGKKPFRELKLVPVPFMMEGRGTVEVLKDLNVAINAQTNQRIDLINLQLNPVILGPKEGTEWKEMIMSPGQHVECKDHTRLNVLRMPPVGEDSFVETQKMLEAGQFAVGINDYLAPSQGANTNLNRTARGIQAIQQQSGVLFSLITELFDLQDVGPTAVDFYTMRQRFQDRVQVVRVAGKDGFSYMHVHPDDLHWTPDIKPVGGSAQPQDRAEKSQKTGMLFQTLFGNPIAIQLGVDQKKLLDMFIADNTDGDPQKFYTDMLQSQDMVLMNKLKEEHTAMMFGSPVPPSGDDAIHLKMHWLFMNMPEFQALNQKAQWVFRDHLMAHQAKLMGNPNLPYFERENINDMIVASDQGGKFGG